MLLYVTLKVNASPLRKTPFQTRGLLQVIRPLVKFIRADDNDITEINIVGTKVYCKGEKLKIFNVYRPTGTYKWYTVDN